MYRELEVESLYLDLRATIVIIAEETATGTIQVANIQTLPPKTNLSPSHIS